MRRHVPICSKWLPILGALALFGCTSLPEQKKIWPWEYGTGQGEPNTGDYISYRAGIANFGEPPKAIKPRPPEPAAPHRPAAKPVPASAPPKSEPPGASEQGRERRTGNKGDGYEFAVTEKRSSLLLDTGDAAYDISAANAGDAPVSVAIAVDNGASHNISADKTLPRYAVVPAHSDRTLVRLSAKTRELGFDVRYRSVWSIGDYTASHDCPEQYRFPFGERIRAFASLTNPADATPYTRNALIFSVPKGTPVLAARKGVVVRIAPDRIDILHEDSTIGTYYHLERIGEHAAVGKTVSTKDVIGIAGRSEDNRDAYLQLAVWRPEPTTGDQVRPGFQRIGFEPVSFPLAFTVAGSDKGNVLTRNQPVSRGTMQASGKRSKRR